MRMRFTILFLLIGLCACSQQKVFNSLSKSPIVASYSLVNDAITSAGVYKSDGTLVRTLWSAQQTAAGIHPVSNLWDGKDDDGNVTTSTVPYTIKVVAGNLTTDWGVIGNTSLTSSGTQWHGYNNFSDLTIVGSKAFVALGYNEAGSSRTTFNVSNPQVRTGDVLPAGQGTAQNTYFVCSDGTLVFWAEQSTENKFWIHATNVSDNAQHTFTNGVSYQSPNTTLFNSVLDLGNDQPTGLACNGTYIFVAHAALNQIHVFDYTGALVQALSVTGTGKMVCDGSNLWAITGTSVKKYPITSGTLGTATVTLTGLINPTSLQVNGTQIAVVDGGTSQQVKFYNKTTGASVYTLGRVGGYATDATVYDDKFMFSAAQSFITFQSDGSYWVGDFGNQRDQHFSSANNYIDNIAYLGVTYSAWTDPNSPTRVFGRMLEFSRDYSKSLSGNNGSWTLVKNWAGSLSHEYVDDDANTSAFNYMKNVTTMSNGRTYCFLYKYGSVGQELFELMSNGVLRATGFLSSLEFYLKADGNLYRQTYSGNIGNNFPSTWTKRQFTSFDGSNNPSWGSETQIETTPTPTDSDPVFRGSGDQYRPGEVTSTGVMASFEGSIANSGYHLGGVKNGNWVWKTAKSTHRTYSGKFPDDGYFDIGNSVGYAGSNAVAIDRFIFQGYHGEGWNAGQVNVQNIFLDNGLFLGQFGTSTKGYQFGAPLMAGNAFSNTLVKVGNDYILHTNDESYNGGVHEYRIHGLTDLQEQTIAIPYPSNYTAPTLDYVDLLAGFTYQEPLTNKFGWTTSPASSTDLEGGGGNWNVSVGKYSYKQPNSISFKYGGGEAIATRDLGTNNLSSWSIKTKIKFEAQPNFNASIYYDIKDAAGKIITRVESMTPDYQTFYVKVNGVIISSSSDGNFRQLVDNLTQLNITVISGVITVTYGTNASVTVSKYDSSANLVTPKSVAITGTGNQYDHVIDFQEPRFYTTNISLP